ncbi:MAG: exodeoxyribonuclease VII large subunit [Deltaproteobacteria bacterium]|nr:exodeoxyribonuclease VII large subunit [Deltaproteobacteria bacterium]
MPEGVLTVHELISRIRTSLEQTFSAQWVTGEVSNLRTPRSGHTYFSLKDADARIQAVFFRHKKRYIRFEPEDGMEVLCKGNVTLYEIRGDLQINVDYMEPLGVGALHIAFEQIKKRLEQEGLFDPARKKVLPLLPRKVGIITSPTGAAIRDILQVMGRRFANMELLISPVRVQGEQAAAEIASAIESLNRRGDPEVLILARGGGSIEDLWPFNEEIVARAIAASSIPVVSAVGHETDFTIADFTADLRAPTPSAAAEIVVRNKLDLEEKISGIGQRLHLAIRRSLEQLRRRVELSAQKCAAPVRTVGMYQQRVDELSEVLFRRLAGRTALLRERVKGVESSLRLLNPRQRAQVLREHLQGIVLQLRREAPRLIRPRRDHVDALTSRLEALSPLKVLSRGYAVVTHPPQVAIVRDVAKLSRSDRIGIRLHRGEVECIVDRIIKE